MGADANIRSYSSYQHQPPLVLPRRGDEGYSVTVFPLRLLRYGLSSAALLAIAVCPSPTGEVRWGLMTSLRYCRYCLCRIVSADGETGPVVEVDDGIRTVGPHYAVAAIRLYSRKLSQPRDVAMQSGNVEGRVA